MNHLHRTQIYLEESQARLLKYEALKEHIPMSQLIRQAIDRFLKSKTKSANWDNDSLIKAVSKIKLKVKDASSNHDRYAYES